MAKYDDGEDDMEPAPKSSRKSTFPDDGDVTNEEDMEPNPSYAKKKKGGKCYKAGGDVPKPRCDKRARGGSTGKWMQKAVPSAHKGKFTAKAEKAGKTVHAYAEKKKDASGTLGKEARLALTFEKAAKKK